MPKALAAAALVVVAVLVTEAPGAAARVQAPATSETRSLGTSPRVQWNANYGYCGETSLISAGMLFGQYTSQWTARALASPGIAQTEEESQLLLGVNDVDAARAMRLDAIAYPSGSGGSPARFLTWVKSMVLRGSPVTIAVFDNMRAFEAPLPGSDEYDHIVPVLGIGSQSRLVPGDRTYRPTDVIEFSDNSLAGDGTPGSSTFRSRFNSFARTRTQANSAAAPFYSLPKGTANYGIAVTGVRDPDRVTIPVRLTSTADGEGLQEGEFLAAPPAPKSIELTATVTIPQSNVQYTVYLYDDFAKVPIRGFNAASANAIESWTIPPGSGQTWSKTITAMTDQTRVFRAVASSSP